MGVLVMKSQTMHVDIMSVIFREGHMTKQYDKHLTLSFFWHSHTSTSDSHPNAVYFPIQWGHRNHRGSCGIKCGTTCREINGGSHKLYKGGESECVCYISSVSSGWLQWFTPCVISTSLQHGFTIISMVTMRTSTDAELNLYFLPPAVLSLQTWLGEVTHSQL